MRPTIVTVLSIVCILSSVSINEWLRHSREKEADLLKRRVQVCSDLGVLLRSHGTYDGLSDPPKCIVIRNSYQQGIVFEYLDASDDLFEYYNKLRNAISVRESNGATPTVLLDTCDGRGNCFVSGGTLTVSPGAHGTPGYTYNKKGNCQKLLPRDKNAGKHADVDCDVYMPTKDQGCKYKDAYPKAVGTRPPGSSQEKK